MCRGEDATCVGCSKGADSTRTRSSQSDLLKRLCGKVIAEFRGIVHEGQINHNARACVLHLQHHVDAAAEAKFSELCATNHFAVDVGKLTGLGFAKVAVEVNKLQSLLREAADLRTMGKAVLQSTARVEHVVDNLLSKLFECATVQQKAWTEHCIKVTARVNKILLNRQYERDLGDLTMALNDLKRHVKTNKKRGKVYTKMLAELEREACGTPHLGRVATARLYT